MINQFKLTSMISKFLTVLMLCFSSLMISANNNPEVKINNEDGTSLIKTEIADILAIEKIIEQEGLTYEELTLKYPNLVASANISASADDEGIFDNDSGTPLGIPGFWWGFCLGWVGILVVYLTMDEGSSRKDQVMNSLWGCIIGAVVFTVAYFALWVTIFGTALF